MTDGEHPAAPHVKGGDAAAGSVDGADALNTDGGWAADSGPDLVSLGFLKAAIRRSATFCCVMAIVGLVIGIGLYKAFPASYQASTTLVLTEGPYENGINSAQDDQALGQTRTVATQAMRELGDQHSVSSFLRAYQVTVESEQVLVVTFAAESASQAVRGANAVAAALLQFRAGLLDQEVTQVLASLTQQVAQAQQQAGSIAAQLRQVQASPNSPERQARLSSLHSQATAAAENLAGLQQALNSDEATARPQTTAAIRGSKAIEATEPLPRSRLKPLLLYSIAGLVGGLVIAIGIVLARAILSDRPRRRGDVADALRAPVVMSTGPLRAGRWLSLASVLAARGEVRRLIWPRRAAAQRNDIERVAAQLGSVVRQHDRASAAVSVVALDDPATAALPVVSLATSEAQHGMRVVVADLTNGCPAARLLGSGQPGVSEATDVPGLVVAVPDDTDMVPQGPLGGSQSPRDHGAAFTDAVTAACSQADLLLTLISLDPWFGGEHLRTWADEAVVIVTAGRSSWTRINAIGELIRLSGTRLLGAILVGADRSDESLGRAPAHQLGRAVGITISKSDATRRPEVARETGRQDGNGRVARA